MGLLSTLTLHLCMMSYWVQGIAAGLFVYDFFFRQYPALLPRATWHVLTWVTAVQDWWSPPPLSTEDSPHACLTHFPPLHKQIVQLCTFSKQVYTEPNVMYMLHITSTNVVWNSNTAMTPFHGGIVQSKAHRWFFLDVCLPTGTWFPIHLHGDTYQFHIVGNALDVCFFVFFLEHYTTCEEKVLLTEPLTLRITNTDFVETMVKLYPVSQVKNPLYMFSSVVLTETGYQLA